MEWEEGKAKAMRKIKSKWGSGIDEACIDVVAYQLRQTGQRSYSVCCLYSKIIIRHPGQGTKGRKEGVKFDVEMRRAEGQR